MYLASYFIDIHTVLVCVHSPYLCKKAKAKTKVIFMILRDIIINIWKCMLNSSFSSYRGFPPDEKLCLSDVVLWLLEQCGRPQTECRHKCMELFYEFIPLLPGEQSSQGPHHPDMKVNTTRAFERKNPIISSQ